MNDTRRFTAQTQALFYNLKAKPLQQMLDFDYLCKRTTPSVAGIIHLERKGFHKAFFGSAEILIPIYTTLQEAVMKQSQADVLVNFASFRSVYASVKEALSTPSIKTIIIVAHRLSTVRECNNIYLLEKGRIIDQGTYAELLANNQQFRKMAKIVSEKSAL